MKKYTYLYAIVALLFLASSCTVMEKNVPGISDMNATVQITMNDLEYVGEVTGTAIQSYVLGMPMGGRRNKVGVSQIHNARGFFQTIRIPDRAWNNAMYDALMSKPDADFIMPISYERTTNQMFLGSKKSITIRAKAFKLKAK